MRPRRKISIMTAYLFIIISVLTEYVSLFQSYDNGLAQGAGLESHGKAS